MEVDAARLTEQLEALAALSDAPAPAVTRVVYTETDLKARAYLKTLIAEVGPDLGGRLRAGRRG